ASMKPRIDGDRNPPNGATNLWVESRIDIERFNEILACNLNIIGQTPQVHLTARGAGTNVAILGDADFKKELPFHPEPWVVPTNLVHSSIQSFTAIQGFEPVLRDLKSWNALRLGTTPKQAFFWAQQPTPFLAFGAA